MKPVTINPDSLSTVARTQGAAAGVVAERAAAERLDVGVLTPTFGVIGADFLAALAQTMNSRAAQLDAAAAAHAKIAADTTVADGGYRTADAANAGEVRV
ncbi:MAG: type VII secretion target [Gordonia sp. (in: high G+C Gram-positive bacteria)]